MTTEERWEFLRFSARRVLDAFRNGRNPTLQNLDDLGAALDSVEMMRVCGHRFVEDCECAEKGPYDPLD